MINATIYETDLHFVEIHYKSEKMKFTMSLSNAGLLGLPLHYLNSNIT